MPRMLSAVRCGFFQLGAVLKRTTATGRNACESNHIGAGPGGGAGLPVPAGCPATHICYIK